MSEWEFPRMVLPNDGLDLKAVVDAFENHLIDQALARTNNNKNRASELLMMNRTTLVEKLRKRGMIVPASKKRDITMQRATGASAYDTNAQNATMASNVTSDVDAINDIHADVLDAVTNIKGSDVNQ